MTIVVLLILAGVSINLVVGQNGLINRAKEASQKTKEAAEGEQKDFDTVTDYIKQTIGVKASGITVDDYGKAVTNYNADGKTWEIFYADDENVYLITRENCGSQSLEIALNEELSYNGTSDFDGSEEFKKKFPAVQAGWLNKIYTKEEGIKYNSSYINMKCTEYLLDSTIWNQKYLDLEKADWVIGGPTLELFIESYNKKYPDNKVTVAEPKDYGYNWNDELYKNNSLKTRDENITGNGKSLNIFNHGYSYWIACPCTDYDGNFLRAVDYDYSCIGGGSYEFVEYFRPIICLKSSATLTLSQDGSTYSIK